MGRSTFRTRVCAIIVVASLCGPYAVAPVANQTPRVSSDSVAVQEELRALQAETALLQAETALLEKATATARQAFDAYRAALAEASLVYAKHERNNASILEWNQRVERFLKERDALRERQARARSALARTGRDRLNGGERRRTEEEREAAWKQEIMMYPQEVKLREEIDQLVSEREQISEASATVKELLRGRELENRIAMDALDAALRQREARTMGADQPPTVPPDARDLATTDVQATAPITATAQASSRQPSLANYPTLDEEVRARQQERARRASRQTTASQPSKPTLSGGQALALVAGAAFLAWLATPSKPTSSTKSEPRYCSYPLVWSSAAEDCVDRCEDLNPMSFTNIWARARCVN